MKREGLKWKGRYISGKGKVKVETEGLKWEGWGRTEKGRG